MGILDTDAYYSSATNRLAHTLARTTSALSPAQRESFGAFMRGARKARQLSYYGVADRASMLVPAHVEVDWKYAQRLESGPPEPLACPIKLAAVMRVYGVSWEDVLRALGVWDGEDWAAEVFRS